MPRRRLTGVERLQGLAYNRPSVSIETHPSNIRGPQVANQTGKRYLCAKCGSEFIVTRGGNGSISCCQQPMELKT